MHMRNLTSLLIIALARPVLAQSEPSTCQATLRAAEKGTADRSIVRALGDCRTSGPPALARIWDGAALPVADLGYLVETSSRLQDGRLYQSVLRVAREKRHETPKRLAALQTVAAYFDPSFAPSLEYLTEGTIGDPIPKVLHRDPVAGAIPLSNERQREVAQLLADIAREETDSVVKAAALRLRQGIEFINPDLTPITAGSVQLIARCGSQVTLQSTADISLTLRIRVLESTYDYTMMLKGLTKNRASFVTLSLPAGIVAVTHGNSEVARLAKRDVPCPPGR
jgi:hypothetical protein